MNGSALANTLTGDGRNEQLNGLGGADFLNGMGGSDRLDGGIGNDTLNGGEGDDILIGGTGNDTLTGGAGADLFVASASGGADVINDFVVGTDLIDLTAFGAYQSIVQSGADTLITLTGGVTMRLLNVVATTVTDSSFVGLPAPSPMVLPSSLKAVVIDDLGADADVFVVTPQGDLAHLAWRQPGTDGDPSLGFSALQASPRGEPSAVDPDQEAVMLTLTGADGATGHSLFSLPLLSHQDTISPWADDGLRTDRPPPDWLI